MDVIKFNDRKALRVKDAAAYAAIGRTRLFELMKDGTIASVKVGRSRLILRESLDRLFSNDQPIAA